MDASSTLAASTNLKNERLYHRVRSNGYIKSRRAFLRRLLRRHSHGNIGQC